MASTPEGKVKIKVRKVLDKCPLIDYIQVVQGGYGKATLDFTCCVNGRYLAVETKAPGEWLTGRQRLICLKILSAGGTVFVISDDEGLDALERWISRNTR